MVRPHWLLLRPGAFLSRYNAKKAVEMLKAEDKASTPIYRSIILDVYIFHDNRLQLFKKHGIVGADANRLVCPHAKPTNSDRQLSIRDVVLKMLGHGLGSSIFADIQFVDFSQEEPLITGERIFRYNDHERATGNETEFGQLDIAILLSSGMQVDQSLIPIQIGNRDEKSPKYLPALTVSRSDMTSKLKDLEYYLGDNVEYPILNKVWARYGDCAKAQVDHQMGHEKLGLARLATDSLTAALLAKQQEPLVLPKPIHGLIAYCSDVWEAGLFFLLLDPIDWAMKVKRDADDFCQEVNGDFVVFTVIGDFSDSTLQLSRVFPAIVPEIMHRKYTYLREDDKAPNFITMLSGTRNGRFRMRYLQANDTTVFDSRTRTSLKITFREDWEEWLKSPPRDNSPPKWIQMQQEDYMVLSKNK
ncbi:uncharacterized protein MYCFIDRAFT_214155 [Pseudocercospora fijiensis CIRAD86]|uniref:Uncharacterized protein n=1 Tax=Pseudocercospora fijiensis (strain CIRAD86) TaxID=383855 RepID=M3BA55_PSEFD|nr:uncharacterized protein MYCFIDRAFT_214155 [Pseudocercospora fijiensis CIRAD86]EME86207.1 hypothetical protein MYCFIDRAFT_214155 [Pseudocercospora fijiensis CIRAD86]